MKPKVFASIRALDGISERTMTEHYKLYQGYVKKVNEIDEKLKTVDRSLANQTYSEIRSLKLDYTFALGGVKNHEIYFANLDGEIARPTGRLLEQIAIDFGGYENWATDFKATGLAARGWAHLAWDYDRQKLFNFLGDAQNSYPVWATLPLVALDVYEHAYVMDFGVDRASYIDAYMKNLRWDSALEKFEARG